MRFGSTVYYLALAVLLTAIKAAPAGTEDFYAKTIFSGRISIRAHASVPDAALNAARERVERMLAKAPRLRDNCESAGMQMIVAGKTQMLSDLPEFRHHKGERFENGEDYDWHTRGSGKLEGRFVSCGEGNLLNYVGDRFYKQDVCVHELSHALMFLGMTSKQRNSVISRFEAAMREGKWKDAYASTSYAEFFADLSIAYFGSEIPTAHHLKGYKRGAAWLKNYDPASYAVLDAIYIEKGDPGKRRIIELKSRPAQELGKLRSGDGVPMRFAVTNTRKTPVHFYWIDFKGRRAQPRDIGPGETHNVESYASHVFLAEGLDKMPVAVFVMGEDDAYATIP